MELRGLIELSDKATPGCWVWSENGNIYGGPEGRFDDIDEVAAVYTDDEAKGSPNAPFIIALVNWFRANATTLAARDDDTTRLDWMLNNGAVVCGIGSANWLWYPRSDEVQEGHFDSPRDAIDAAIAAAPPAQGTGVGG